MRYIKIPSPSFIQEEELWLVSNGCPVNINWRCKKPGALKSYCMFPCPVSSFQRPPWSQILFSTAVLFRSKTTVKMVSKIQTEPQQSRM